jgi:superfamily II DNA or RNA helicase/transcriptional regulator with XRE-family HTH domain
MFIGIIISPMKPEEIKNMRIRLGYSQQELAALLGVTFATVNRWENGKAKPQKDRVERLRSLLKDKSATDEPATRTQSQLSLIPRLDFEGDAEALKLVVDAYRLQNGHLFNKAYGLELSTVVPLPHQRIAVYEHMLPQNPMRFFLADDAGAGKTIMTGLYIREMVNRGRLSRVLVCCPAGLTWNWQRELKNFFDLDFTVLRGADFSKGNSLPTQGKCFVIVSVDTAATESVKNQITAEQINAFDLIVFDEAHKLSWNDAKRADSKTRRYRLAEDLGNKTTHFLLLTATPHMGKSFPYAALWRLLDGNVFTSEDAVTSLPVEKRPKYFIRRLKEEMIDYDGRPIYMPRLCQTISFQLTEAEQHFYKEVSEYLRWSYETNTSLNKNAAAMVLAVLQRRLASSTHAMVESLKRRKARLIQSASESEEASRAQQVSLKEVIDYFDSSTADDSEPAGDGLESDERIESAALDLVKPKNAAQLQKELEYLERTIEMGESVRSSFQEAKFFKLRELIESAQYQNEKLLIFTEHRDTLEYLIQRFEALGYTGQIAHIHGGMDVEERERQRIFFMPPDIRRLQGIKNPDAVSARIMLATDAAGEGINLQFAWIMVNFDIPWNPARLEQRMGRLHRFGQKHPEVRIFNLVAENTREGDVLATLLEKLEEAREALCSDKVFDVVGQLLRDVSLRDLLRDALFETPPYTAQKKLDSIFATQKLRATIEEQRKNASTYGDVAKRLGQLNTEIDVERFTRLLPAYVQNFVEKAAPRLGVEIQGDLTGMARFAVTGEEGRWLYGLSDHFKQGLPDYLSVKRDLALEGIDSSRCAFLRPGEIIFDSMCKETISRFRADVLRGAALCDPSADKPYYIAVYICQIGELAQKGLEQNAKTISDRLLLGIRWDETGNYEECASNQMLALLAAPRSMIWKAGALLLNPEDQVYKADSYARMLADATFLQQMRTKMQAETVTRLDDLTRGYDYLSSELAQTRSELARKAREGDESAQKDLEEIRDKQKRMEDEKAKAMLYEQGRADRLDITRMERIAVALVVPDTSPAAQETYDKNIEEMAMRIARNFEVDRYQAHVYDVSSPRLARGYDLESHRANGEKVVIEVKGRAGRGPVQLTENEWPTAANIRERYWLYVVVDCATKPVLYRVQDPAFKLAVRTRQSFSINIGDIIQEAERD